MARATELAIRKIVYVVASLVALGLLGYNGWLLAGGVDVAAHTRGLLSSITLDTWRALGLSAGMKQPIARTLTAEPLLV